MAIKSPWRWVTWSWVEWHGHGQNYSHPHLVDPAKSTRELLKTACGLSVGRVLTSRTTTDPPPPNACEKCVAAWRAS